jgi:hypothetical protein
MGGLNKTGTNSTHDAALLAAEVVRQNAVQGVASSAAGQVVMNAAEIAWARACIVSCNANNGGVGVAPFIAMLRSLGVNS